MTAIAKDGKQMTIPARDHVYLGFTPDGHFLANEPINFHSGTYRLVGDGFTIGLLGVTLVGYLLHCDRGGAQPNLPVPKQT